jgi:UDPglucose--hexose-1-phosphate uridylyltransferase
MNDNKIQSAIHVFVEFGIKKGYILKQDRVLSIDKISQLLQLKDVTFDHITRISKEQAIKYLVEDAIHRGVISSSIMDQDILGAELYDCIMPDPTTIKKPFHKDHQVKETDLLNLHDLSVDVNYIKETRNLNNVSFSYHSQYGRLELTINLAKPEKDPKDIAQPKDLLGAGIPLCVLCKENEQNRWNARKNLRLLPLTLAQEPFHFQYSPYAYFPYHSIILHDQHIPMVMNQTAIHAMVDFVDQYPSFMIGSNAELPIVGGSILNHWHFQAGIYTFPIEAATSLETYHLKDMEVDRLYWPLSTLKVTSSNSASLIKLITHIHETFKHYNNQELALIAFTNKHHHTITPIIRKDGDQYIAYVMLRSNLTSQPYPEGIFHSHKEDHHIKKENIGLIEAMGLAILPGRLKVELEEARLYLKGDIKRTDALIKHEHWVNTLKQQDQLDLYQEVGVKFLHVLETCGVFKHHQQDQEAFHKFIVEMIKSYETT